MYTFGIISSLQESFRARNHILDMSKLTCFPFFQQSLDCNVNNFAIIIVRSLSGKNWQDRDKADKVSISFSRDS